MSPGVCARLWKLNGGNARCVCQGPPPSLSQGNRGCPHGPLNTATETLRSLVGRVPTPCTHLRLITASPARVCGLVGDCTKGLPGRGLREAGLEQEDRREDWLSVCVLTEPCEDKARKSGRPCPWDRPLRPPFRALVLPANGTTYLETCGQHFHRAFPIGLPRRGCPGPKERAEGVNATGVLEPCLAAAGWRLQLSPHQVLKTNETSQTFREHVVNF